VEFLLFLIQVFIISFSGAMQPGPVTATVIKMGVHNRWAGALLAAGHGIIEFPLMVIIILGMGKYFQMQKVQIAIGLAGGAFLIIMAIQTFLGLKSQVNTEPKALESKSALNQSGSGPVLAGIILTASNPYFLIWWTTIGLSLAQKAKGFGIWAFAIFAVAHWSVDLIWLQLLSFAGCKGSVLLGRKGFTYILAFCGAALFGFGLWFIYSALELLFQ
jgi:threonine/homoserine/homoserine lactone efflux protein